MLDNTRPASFKGVPFRVRAVETTEGQNRANYIFINTGRRASKALGPYPADFAVTAFTHGKTTDEYNRNRDALRTALSDSAPGILVHPFLGNFTCVAGKFKFNENYEELGICRFTIPFFVAEKDGDSPRAMAGIKASASSIRSKATDASRKMQRASGAAFGASSVRNKASAKSLFERTGDAVREVFGPIGESIEKISDYTGKALAYREQAAYYMANPYVGFAAMADQIFGIDGLTNDVFSKFLACQALFDFGNDDDTYSASQASPYRIPPDPQTEEDAERVTNSQVLTTFMQTSATIEAMAQAGNMTFETTDDLNDAVDVINNQFQNIADLLTQNPESEIYNFNVTKPDYSESYDALKSLHLETLEYLEQQRLETPRVEYIEVAQQPASVLSYTLYGTSDRADQIMALNGLRDTMAVSGLIKVIAE